MKKLLFFAVLLYSSLVNGQFIKEYNKSATQNTRFHAIVPVNDSTNSNLYVAGNYGDQLLVGEIKQNGSFVWTRRIMVNDPDYTINAMIRDSDGNIVFCGGISTGAGDDANAFIVKFNPLLKSLVWLQKTEIVIGLYDLTEMGSGGEYAVSGQEEYVGNGNGADHVLFTVDRLTGTLTLISNLNQHLNETAENLIYVPGSASIYTSGRYELNIGISKFRICLTKMDQFGNIDWTKFYIKSLAQTGRFYAEDMIQDGDNILMAGFGDDAGTSAFKNLFLLKTDLDGNMVWTKKFDITTTTNDGVLAAIKKYNSGYILYGVLNNVTETNIFLMNIDFEGNINWAKTYPYRKKQNPSGFYACSSLALVGNYIFHVGESLQLDGSIRGVFMKTKINTGDVSTCDEDLSMTMTTLIDPYQGTFSLEDITFAPVFTQPLIAVKNQSLVTNTTCPINALAKLDGIEISESNDFEKLGGGTNILLYPNPVDDVLIVELNMPDPMPMLNIQIMNVQGVLIKEIKQPWSEDIEIQIADLPAGIYIFKLIDDGTNHVYSSIITKE